MENSHHHHHHHHVMPKSLNGVFVFSIVLNLLYVAIEAGVGLWQDSLSLLSDAGHNLSDVFSLLLVLIAFRLAKVNRSKNFTYGMKKSTILISLLNAIILVVAVCFILIESIHKLYEPSEINGAAVSWTAGVGIVINGATALLLMRGQKKDLNVRGAYLHMAADTLVSMGVVISGIVISLTGWNLVDPIVGIAIATVIMVSTWHLLSESVKLSLDGTPESVDVEEVEKAIEAVPHVCSVHHVHVWAMSTTENAMTAHLVVDDVENMESVKQTTKVLLRQKNIAHTTLETETLDSHCHEQTCEGCGTC